MNEHYRKHQIYQSGTDKAKLGNPIDNQEQNFLSM
jgi:hypothetical protein